MSGLEALAAAVAAVVASAFVLVRLRSGSRGPASRAARFVLWLAIASPLPVLLIAPEDRPRVLVRGPDGAFEALRLLAFAAAAAGVVASLPGGPRRWWSTAVLVLVASLLALAAAVLWIR